MWWYLFYNYLSNCRHILFFLILILSIFLLILSIFGFIFEVGISFYSVIMMNYVFFVSSIVSNMMAPIYQSLSEDWINFTFSITQVILASPLISFYIFYILKSVTSLASFISEIPGVIQHISYILIKGNVIEYKELISIYISDFFWNDFSLIYEWDEIKTILILFGVIYIILLSVTACLAYAEFCFDKTIILLGSICYIINTIQIILLIFPSYIYFFQILFNISNAKRMNLFKNT